MHTAQQRSVFQPPLPGRPDKPLAWQHPPGSAYPLAIAQAARRHTGLTVIVCADTSDAHQLEDELKVLGGDGNPIMHFPDWETLPYDRLAPHPDTISRRLATLYHLPRVTQGILVVPVSTLLQRLAPREYVAGNTLLLDRGQSFDLDTTRASLEDSGYRRVSQVYDPGDFAVRGNLLDLFPMGHDTPFRIELFDDEIESIRRFDPETQRTVEQVEQVRLLPGREFPFDEDARRRFRQNLRSRFTFDPRECDLYRDVRAGSAPAGIEYYLPLFFEHTHTLFDYLPDNALLIHATGVAQAAGAFWRQTASRYEQRRHDVRRPLLPPEMLYLAPKALQQELLKYLSISIRPDDSKGDNCIQFATAPPPSLPLHRRGKQPAAALHAFLDAFSGRVLFAADSPGRREALLDTLTDFQIRPQAVNDWTEFAQGEQKLALTVAPLEAGMLLEQPPLAVLTETELFGERAQQRRRRARPARDPDAVIRDLTDLGPGAPVVHEGHGVGRYRGLKRLCAGGRDGEYLELEYADADRLYVPVSQLQLVSRYTGGTEETAPLHRLGGDQWEKAKHRAAQQVRDVAAELLEIQAKRETRSRAPLALDERLYQDFSAAFPFEETPDQEATIQQVLADLKGGWPMDRVVCGDVGFGKTEVALRAAFAAVQGGRQVALLAPTTLLAQQHFETFRDRFADWPVRVEVLSRFRTGKAAQAVLDGLADGSVDIVIGTHRLLQPQVRFKQLGLVIVDEEHRFGVRQKERLKALRAEVDLLTLTATPIPRTLNMSLSGLRDLSLIASPPAGRLAIKTFIGPWDAGTVREACLREIQRGGQIYFLHNEVKTIERTAQEVQALMPEAQVRVAHGQMPEKALEQVMLDFYRQRFNLLVCSTIVESGIDIPNANTIVMHRADKLGLAQLHQLRGRVGRSHHRAYAYLIVPDRRAMTADAIKRIEALAAMEELGSGFTLATHDLEIRGAGELLGQEQTGQIHEVGFNLYTELLDRAIHALKSGQLPAEDAGEITDVELHIPALIPDDYLPDVHARLILYKRIASARSEDALRELQVEMIDRFGLLPDAAKNLFAVARLKLQAQPLGITRLEFGEHGGRVAFRTDAAVDPQSLIRLVQREPGVYRFQGEHQLKISAEYPQGEQRLEAAAELLQQLPAREAA